MNIFVDALEGEIVAPDALHAPKARALAWQLARAALPYARLLECRRAADIDIIMLEVDVEVVQRRVHDIHPTEQLAVLFSHDDLSQPEVLSLRDDFPHVPHTNLRPTGWPHSLCLFEERYRDLKIRWTPARFIVRIRDWLRLTARGELHASDQPLEPLLSDVDGTIILPHDLINSAEDAAITGVAAQLRPLMIVRRPDHDGRIVLVATPTARGDAQPKDSGTGFVATVFLCRAQAHGIIQHTPRTLKELHDLISACGTDLLGSLREQLYQWKETTPALLDARLVLVVGFPKTRAPGAEVEASDIWVFLTGASVREVGEAVGRWALHDGTIAALISADLTRDGSEVGVGLLNPSFTLSREAAAHYNGLPSPSELRITAIGCGALGSEVVMNAARAAFGRWALIDEDLLLPHNLARNALDRDGVGWPKVQVLAAVANAITDGPDVMTPIVADILEPGAEATLVSERMRDADAIVDMSASVTVARYIARDLDTEARRVSLFLNPTGTDLTVLAEDSERHIPLDALEMQYYRALVHHPELAGHLQSPANRVRYGRSCRDVSVQLSQELVALHAAIATRALRATVQSGDPAIRMWRADQQTLAVSAFAIDSAAVHVYQVGEWTIYTDKWVLGRLAELREARLPNETGGVLLGAFDLERRVAYVVDTIPSPPDSEEWPVLYIRGCVGLPEAVRSVEDVTTGQLHYVGEWHSHPDGCSCRPSEDDMKVFAWLAEHMDADGLPALMLIVGEDGAAPFLGTMHPDSAVKERRG